VDGSFIITTFVGPTGNGFDPAILVPPAASVPSGSGNAATPCSQGPPCSDNVAVRDDWTEFASATKDDTWVLEVDLTTSGLLTLSDTRAAQGSSAVYEVSLKSSAYTAFQGDFAVITNTFAPARTLGVTLVGDTLTINVPKINDLPAGTAAYTIRFGPPQVLKSNQSGFQGYKHSQHARHA
jgi:hypothetical protein